jgi:hypothetical protein
MNNTYKFCFYATENTPYVAIANTSIIASLNKLGIDYDFAIVPDLGNWNRNTAFKPKFAKMMLEKHIDKNIIIIDVDAAVMKDPILFNHIPEQYNIAAHILNHREWYRRDSARKELLTGTLFLRNNDRTKMLVNQWEDYCIKNLNMWEQQALQFIIKANEELIFELPLSYCYINTLPNGLQPYIHITDPYIVHYQASRQHRFTTS